MRTIWLNVPQIPIGDTYALGIMAQCETSGVFPMLALVDPSEPHIPIIYFTLSNTFLLSVSQEEYNFAWRILTLDVYNQWRITQLVTFGITEDNLMNAVIRLCTNYFHWIEEGLTVENYSG